MRVSLFVSALFAASLLGGVAMADRPSDDGGRSTRFSPREARQHEPRQMREAREHDGLSKARDSKLTDKLRTRGDMVDRYGSHGVVQSKGGGADVAGLKAQRDAQKAMERLNAKQNAVRNCSPTDDTCGSSRAAAAGAKASAKAEADKAAANRQAEEVKKMIDKLRAEKLRARIMKSLCEKHANMCSENL
jgi:hypothetical protein